MTSDGKVFYTEVVCIVETVNFVFGVIIIGDSIWPGKLLQYSDSSENCIIESGPCLKMGPESQKDGLKTRSGMCVLCRSSRRTSLMLNSTPSELVCDFYGPRKMQDRSVGQIRAESELD